MSRDEMLLPCPFCGGPAHTTKEIAFAKLSALVMCTDNDCVTMYGETLPKTVSRWNTRLSASLLDGLGQTKSADCGNSNKQSAQGLSRATGGDA